MSMTQWRRPSVLVALVLSLGVGGVSGRQEPVTLAWTLPETLTLHEPVVFSYVLINASPARAAVDVGYDAMGAFEFDLRLPDGRRRIVRPSPREGGALIGDWVLQPAEEFRREAALGEWLDFPMPGIYQLTVRFTGDLGLGKRAGPDGWEPRTATIRVLPRDEARLKATCAALFERAMHRTGDVGAALHQLAYIRDPVAIPYLEELLAAGRASRFFDTLAEIGGPEARQALERLATNRIDWVARNAKNALQRMK